MASNMGTLKCVSATLLPMACYCVGLDFGICFSVGWERRLLLVGPGMTPRYEMFYSDLQAHTFKGQRNMTGRGLNDFFFSLTFCM